MVDLFKKCYHDSPGQDNKFTSDSVRLSDMEYLHLWVVVTESNLIGLYRTDYLLFLQCNFVKLSVWDSFYIYFYITMLY